MLALLVAFALVTPQAEVVRIQTHLGIVDQELRAADVSGLTGEQRMRRAAVIDELARYRARAVFPRNLEFGEATPFFIDDRGVRCAMAHLIETHGGAALVSHVAATLNNAYVRELAGDATLRSWLVEHGVTAAEAARIQPTYPRMPGERCTGALACMGSTCEPTADDPDLAYCSPVCDPASPDCPIGIEGVAMECQPRGAGHLCVYPTPSPGSLGWACGLNDPASPCAWACISDGAGGGECTPPCSDARACPTDYACESRPPGADYLRSCVPVEKGGCTTTQPPSFLLALLWMPLLRRRRVCPKTG